MTFYVSFCRTTSLFIFMGVSMNMSSLFGDAYVNMLVSVSLEFPAYFMLWGVLEKWGRKPSMMVFMFGIVLCSIISFVLEFFEGKRVVFWFFQTLSNTISNTCIFINTLAPEIFEWHFIQEILKLHVMIGGLGMSREIALRWISLNLSCLKSALAQVMTWCRQATSHDQRQSWPISLWPLMTSSNQMETFSPLLAICAGHTPVTGEFPTQRPVTRSFGVFCDLRRNKRLSKQSWGRWFESPSGLLWRHCDATVVSKYFMMWCACTAVEWASTNLVLTFGSVWKRRSLFEFRQYQDKISVSLMALLHRVSIYHIASLKYFQSPRLINVAKWENTVKTFIICIFVE